MIKYIAIVLSIILGACSTMSVNSGPLHKAWEGSENDYRHFVSTDYVETNAFAPSTSTNMMMECKYPIDQHKGQLVEQEGLEELSNQECRRVKVDNHNAGAGVMPSFGSAIISASGTVGAAYLIGKGLASSGRTNVTNGSNSASAADSGSESSADADADADAKGGNVGDVTAAGGAGGTGGTVGDVVGGTGGTGGDGGHGGTEGAKECYLSSSYNQSTGEYGYTEIDCSNFN